MSEPIYRYEKGKGWTVSTHQKYYVTDYDGNNWWLIEMEPCFGDLWDAVDPDFIDSYLINFCLHSPKRWWRPFTQEIKNKLVGHNRILYTLVPA